VIGGDHSTPENPDGRLSRLIGSGVTDAVRVGRGMPRAPVPFCGCGGTPHGRGSFAEPTVSGGRLSGRGKGVAKQTGLATRGHLFTLCTKKGGVGTWWRRNLSGTVSVTWSSVPGGCRRRAWLVLTVVPVGERRVKGSGMAGVPSQREGTGQEKRRKREGRGSLAMGGNGPGIKGESRKAGVPSQWEGTGQEERRKRESRGSLAMGGNGPGREEKAGKPGFPRNGREWARKKGESGKAGVPSQWEGTDQEERRKEKAGKPGFPRNGRERARKKGESGLSARSEAESESVLELD
jgi:hypothetical protein